VVGGTINGSGSFRYRAEKVGRDTALAQIVRLVQEAQGRKAPIQRIADRIAGQFVPAVVAVAVLAFAVWMLAGPEPRFIFAMVSFVTVLIIACPCALGPGHAHGGDGGHGRGGGARRAVPQRRGAGDGAGRSGGGAGQDRNHYRGQAGGGGSGGGEPVAGAQIDFAGFLDGG
jgi:hypothetical protein